MNKRIVLSIFIDTLIILNNSSTANSFLCSGINNVFDKILQNLFGSYYFWGSKTHTMTINNVFKEILLFPSILVNIWCTLLFAQNIWYIIMLVSWVSATNVIFAIVCQRVSLVSVSRSVRAWKRTLGVGSGQKADGGQGQFDLWAAGHGDGADGFVEAVPTHR